MIHGVDVSNYQAASGWEDGVDQADFFLSRVALAPGDVLCLDWEDSGVSTAQKDAWISYVQAVTGHRVVLYCNKSFWFGTNDFAGDGLWIATAGATAGDPGISSPWLIHQYSTAGGIDHDVAQFDTRSDMAAWAGGNMATDLTAAAITAVATKVLTIDGVIANPNPDTAADNPFIALATAVRNIEIVVRRMEASETARAAATTVALNAILSQAQTNGTGISEIKLALTALDLSGIADDIAAKLEALKINITVTEGP